MESLADRIVRSLVTAIDWDGRGTIVLSARDGEFRRTAAFRIDVRHGVLDAVGEVERERPSAGRLIDEWIDRAEGDYALDVPELAVSLLRGSLVLSGKDVPDPVRTWLEATIGLEILPFGLPPILPGPPFEAIPAEEMSSRVNQVLDACPAWLDRSALTFEMAEEISLRERDASPDPIRDAGAYRYLFEHLLCDRLEIFARMLLWMGWVWHASGRPSSRDRRSPWPASSRTSSTPCRPTRLPWCSRPAAFRPPRKRCSGASVPMPEHPDGLVAESDRPVAVKTTGPGRATLEGSSCARVRAKETRVGTLISSSGRP